MLALIAWRNVWRNKLRSLVVIFSIAVGLWAGIFITAFAWGLYEQNIQDVIQNQLSHLQVHSPSFAREKLATDTLAGSRAILTRVRAIPQVRAVTLRSLSTGMIASPSLSAGVSVNGVDPESETAVTHLASRIAEGEYFSQGKGQILIGRKLADKLNVGVRSKVVVTLQDTHDEIVSGAFRIKGIFRSKNSLFDETQIYLRSNELTAMLGIGETAHEAAVLLHEDSMTDSARASLELVYPSLSVQTWRDLAPELDLIVSSFNQYMYLFIGIILLALTFGIVNTMLMAVLERYRELGMLMAIGLNRTRVFLMIMLETVYLAAVGGPLGVIASEFSIRGLARHGLDLSAFSEGLSAYGYSTLIYPSIDREMYLTILLMTLTVTLLSSVYPAWKALRLNPAQAIRKI
jgi:ABC-type lipoprotein release transport system permease subunit